MKDFIFLAATKQLYEWFSPSVRHWVTVCYKFSRKHPCHNWLFNSLTSCVGSCYQTETAINGSVVLGADESPWPCGTPSWYTPLSCRMANMSRRTCVVVKQMKSNPIHFLEWFWVSRRIFIHSHHNTIVFFPKTSVHPSVCLSHLFHYVPIIVSSWNFQELLPMTKMMSMQKVKVRGQRSRSQVKTPFSRFQTVTTV